MEKPSKFLQIKPVTFVFASFQFFGWFWFGFCFFEVSKEADAE
jgi:hypothetical protein